MELYNPLNGGTRLTLTTAEEIKVISLVANNNWAKYPNIFHPFKRSVHRNLARRAFAAAHQISDTVQPFPLTSKETAIIARGIPNLENALLKFDETFHYTTNTLSRDATALRLAASLRKINTKE